MWKRTKLCRSVQQSLHVLLRQFANNWSETDAAAHSKAIHPIFPTGHQSLNTVVHWQSNIQGGPIQMTKEKLHYWIFQKFERVCIHAFDWKTLLDFYLGIEVRMFELVNLHPNSFGLWVLTFSNWQERMCFYCTSILHFLTRCVSSLQKKNV